MSVALIQGVALSWMNRAAAVAFADVISKRLSSKKDGGDKIVESLSAYAGAKSLKRTDGKMTLNA